jgi:hypothetical protein
MKDFYQYLEIINNLHLEESEVRKPDYKHEIIDFTFDPQEHAEINGNKINLSDDYEGSDFGIFNVKNYKLYITYNEKKFGPFNIKERGKETIYSKVYEKEYDYTDPDHSDIFREIIYRLTEMIDEKRGSFFRLKNNKIYAWMNGRLRGPFDINIRLENLFSNLYKREYTDRDNWFVDELKEFKAKYNL